MSNKSLLVIFAGLLIVIIALVGTMQSLLPAFLSPFVVAVYVVCIIKMCT